MEGEPINRVLVICGHNAGRSQITEAFFNDMIHLYPTLERKWEAVSAGTNPGETVNPLVMQAMSEVGINLDPSRHFPKSLDSDFIRSVGPSIRRVIIACDDDCVLPAEIPPDIPKESWKLPDPHEQPIEVIRKVRDLAQKEVLKLLTDLARLY